jgi:hypothetical protein
VAVFRAWDSVTPGTHRYVLILSHMRAGSSLLLHLLLGSREIRGGGEQNSTYRDTDDLVKLAIKTMLQQPSRFMARYSVDQINHTRMVESTELLTNPVVCPIILLREPRGAIGSMVDVLGKHYGFRLTDATAYYRERLTALLQYVQELRQTRELLLLTYGEMVDESERSLHRLEEYLGLHGSLSHRYPVEDFSGVKGDPSSRIKAGRILAPRRHEDLDIDPRQLQELTGLYRDCVDSACKRGD